MDKWTPSRTDSTVKVLSARNITRDDMVFIAAVGRHLAKRYKVGFKSEKFNLALYMDRGRMTICYDGKGRATGLMLARLYTSIFDDETKILQQDLLYARPGSRASKVLLDDFIDFGRKHADHILTTIGTETAIKGESLEKLGFSRLETTYRMET